MGGTTHPDALSLACVRVWRGERAATPDSNTFVKVNGKVKFKVKVKVKVNA